MADQNPLGIRKLPPWGRRGWGMILILLLFAGVLRGWRLSEPANLLGDELYYVAASRTYLLNVHDLNEEHPPLGKILIAAGIRLGQACESLSVEQLPSYGYIRLSSLLSGLGIVFFTFALAYRVSLGSLETAELAAFFVASDFLSIIFSRLAMLDCMLSLWWLIGAYFGWLCLESIQNKGRYSWGLAAISAVAFSLAFATKWNGFVGGLVVYIFVVALSKGEAGKIDRKAQAKKAALLFCLFFVIFSSLYMMSYLPQLFREGFTTDTVLRILHYPIQTWPGRNGENYMHPMSSPFWAWPIGLYPYIANITVEPDGTSCYLIYCGSIIFWWPGFLFTIKYFITGIKQKRFNWVFITSIWLANWLIWILATGGGFIHYMLPGIPFMAIVMAWVIEKWAHERRRKLIGFYFLMLSTALAIYYPTLTFLPIRIDLCPILFPSWFINLLALLRAVLYG